MSLRVIAGTVGGGSLTLGSVRRAETAVGRRSRRLLLTAALLAAGTVVAAQPLADSRPAPGNAWLSVEVARGKVDPGIPRTAERVNVVVQATPGMADEAVARVNDLGGTVGVDLPIVNGFEAWVPGAAAEDIARSEAIHSITLDREGRFEEFSYDETTTASNFTRTSGATTAWAQGNLGQGVGVAVIDTGISEMNDVKGRVVYGPDLSGEGTLIDTYGHGTVMGGVIAGGGNDSASNPGGAYTGVAPGATLVAVKVAGRNGAVDVSTVLQAMHWVSAYKSQFNIRVMNLSWGTKSTQNPSVDPLNYAVQRLWKEGIVVVVAAGNSGPNAGTILKPADDPLVITVGAFDDKQDSDPNNDSVPSWTSRGPTAAGLAKPDIVAPGRTLIALRSYGSAVEVENPKALIAPSYIKGSGSSESAAVVSGLVALMLKARPELTPDQVKSILKKTALPLGTKTTDTGSGRVQLGAALAASPSLLSTQTATSTGLGSIEASRGGMNVETDCGNNGTVDVIRGEIDVRCEAWTGSAWTGSAWTGSAWTGSAWTGSAWTGSAWTGSAWTGSAWTGSAWTGGTWTGSAWTGSAWTNGEFTSAVYESEFQNAWWGNRPSFWAHIPGELPDPATVPSNRRVS